MSSKKHLSIIASLIGCAVMSLPLFPGSHMQAEAAQGQSLPNSVTVLGKTLTLKDNKGGGPGQKFIAEYIPGNETFDNWTLMFASRYIPGAQQDPLVAAEATAKRIMARRDAGDYVANAAVYKAPDGKSVAVDFLMSEGKIMEHNVFRYFKTPNGMASFQIARRIYESPSNDGEVHEFIESIRTMRNQIFQETLRTDLPAGDSGK